MDARVSDRFDIADSIKIASEPSSVRSLEGVFFPREKSVLAIKFYCCWNRGFNASWPRRILALFRFSTSSEHLDARTEFGESCARRLRPVKFNTVVKFSSYRVGHISLGYTIRLRNNHFCEPTCVTSSTRTLFC